MNSDASGAEVPINQSWKSSRAFRAGLGLSNSGDAGGGNESFMMETSGCRARSLIITGLMKAQYQPNS